MIPTKVEGENILCTECLLGVSRAPTNIAFCLECVGKKNGNIDPVTGIATNCDVVLSTRRPTYRLKEYFFFLCP